MQFENQLSKLNIKKNKDDQSTDESEHCSPIESPSPTAKLLKLNETCEDGLKIKSITNSLDEEAWLYRNKLSKLYEFYNKYPQLLESRRSAIHFAFKLIFLYNVDDRNKIQNKLREVDRKDQLLDKKRSIREKIKRHEEKTEVLTPNDFTKLKKQFDTINLDLKKLVDLEKAINMKKNYKISFYTLYRAVRLYELWTYRSVVQVKEKDRESNTKFQCSASQNLLNIIICLVLASKIEDYTPLSFMGIYKIISNTLANKDDEFLPLIKTITPGVQLDPEYCFNKGVKIFCKKCKELEYSVLEAMDYNIMNQNHFDILSNIKAIFQISYEKFKSVLLILTSLLYSRRMSKYMSTEVILSTLLLIKYENPFSSVVSDKEVISWLEVLGFNAASICECMIVVTVELMKLYSREGSNDDFKKYVYDIKYMAKGISVKDDLLDFSIDTKYSSQIESILRRPLALLDVNDMQNFNNMTDQNYRGSKEIQEEISKMIFAKLKDNLKQLSVHYNITADVMSITIDKLIKEDEYKSFSEMIMIDK